MSTLLYYVDFVDGALITVLARRNVGKHCKHSYLFQLLRYNSPICYVSNINALCKAQRCSSCGPINKTAGFLERHLTTYEEQVEHLLPKNVYQLLETLFDKLDLFGILFTEIQTLFKNMAWLQSAWKTKVSRIPKQQYRLGNTFQFWYRHRPTCYRSPFCSAILILVTW